MAAEAPWQKIYDEGLLHFQAGRWQKASAAFSQAFLLEPGNPEISFYLGRAAFEQGDFENAIMAFDRVLITDPDSSRVKLELGRSFMGLKAWSIAHRYFNEVLDSSPPPEVVRNIESMLDHISRAQQRHFLSGMLMLDYSMDDNAYAAPASSTVRTLLGDVVLTGTGASPVSDQTVNTSLAFSHRFQGEAPFGWQSAAVFVNSTYDTEDALDVNYLGVSTGPTGQNGRLGWEFKGLAALLELDGHSYLATSGMEGRVSLGLSSRIRIDSVIRAEDKDFRTVGGRDAVTVRAALSPVMVIGPNRVTLSLAGEKEDAESEVYSYDRLQATLRYERQLPRDLLFSVSQEYRRSEYKQQEPLFGSLRDDEFWESAVGLTWVFWRSRDLGRTLSGRINYVFQNSNSTIPLYTYEKEVVTVSLGFEF